MKNLFLTLAIVMSGVALVAQDQTKMLSADRLILGIYTDFWSGLPEGMSQQSISRGFSIDYIQEYPLGTSNFSVAAGLGFAGHNLYSDHVYFDTDATGNHEFVPVEEVYSSEYSNNKISLNYITVPLEVRFRTRNVPKVFRIHAGIKGGYLISGHTKYVGEIAPDRRETKLKEKKLENIEDFLVGFHARVGYGKINVNTFISLTDIFSDNNAQQAAFMSVGVSLIVF